MEPSVGIVIVNYNGENYQNDCIESLLDCGYKNFFIIIVDNKSTDDSMIKVEKLNNDKIITIYNSSNLGIAEGNNIGIRKSIELGCYYTLLLNNDTVVEKGFLNKLTIDDEDLVTPKIYFYRENIIWYGGGKLGNMKGCSYHINYKRKDIKLNFKKYYNYAPTCCLLIKNSVFKTVGFMNKEYFLYFDDTDFMYKLYKKGFRIRLCQESVIYHKVSMSTGGENSPIYTYYSNRNRLMYIKNNNLGLIPYLYSIITRKIKILIFKIIKNDNWKYIQEALNDYKSKRFFRKEDFDKIKDKY